MVQSIPKEQKQAPVNVLEQEQSTVSRSSEEQAGVKRRRESVNRKAVKLKKEADSEAQSRRNLREEVEIDVGKWRGCGSEEEETEEFQIRRSRSVEKNLTGSDLYTGMAWIRKGGVYCRKWNLLYIYI